MAPAQPAQPSFNPFNLPAAHAPPPEEDTYAAHAAAAARYAAALAAFLSAHGFLLEVHSVQFFTRRPLARLPPPWLEQLAATPLGTAHAWLTPQADAPAPEAGSLGAWFAEAAALTMPRQPAPGWQAAPLPAPRAGSAAHAAAAAAGAPPPARPLAPLPRCAALHTKPKKLHELARFAHVAAAAAQRCGCAAVVDGGAGLGRLGGVLAMTHGLLVTGIERSADNVAKAAQRRAWADTNRARQRYDASAPGGAAVVLQGSLGGDESGASSAEALCGGARALLCGLHACGELTNTLLREFSARGSSFDAVLVAGCCYQHIESFPLSTAVAAVLPAAGPATLPRRVREAAAQSADVAFVAAQPRKLRDAIRTKALARALLEQLWRERHGGDAPEEDADAHVSYDVDDDAGCASALESKHPYDPRTAFSAYAHAALSSGVGFGADTAAAAALPPLPPLSAEDAAALDARFAAVLRDEGAPFAGFYVLRAALGALAEALLVTDRALFLHEALCAEAAAAGDAAGEARVALAVTPVFDPARSPRNLVLWASRAG
jgi:hypothetical protein